MKAWWIEWLRDALTVAFLLFASGLGCAVPIASSIQHQLLATHLIDQGVVALRAGSLDDAKAAFQLASELGGTAQALDGLGCVAIMESDFKGAVQFFTGAIERDPTYSAVYGNLALLYDLAGRPDDARQLYRYALKISPENYRARNNFAVLLHEYRDREPIKGDSQEDVHQELLKALALAKHPVISNNVELSEEMR